MHLIYNTLKLVVLFSILVGCGGEKSNTPPVINMDKNIENANRILKKSVWEGTLVDSKSDNVLFKIDTTEEEYKVFFPSQSCFGVVKIKSSSDQNITLDIEIKEGSCKYNGILELAVVDEKRINCSYRGEEILNGEIELIKTKLIHGRVLDKNKNPILGAKVKFQYLLDKTNNKETFVVNQNGEYYLNLNKKYFSDYGKESLYIVYAYKEGYVPEVISFPIAQKDTFNIDFTMNLIKKNELILEIEPQVHHLGNDYFSGSINSKFQLTSEGLEFTKSFYIAQKQYDNYTFSTLTFEGKGIQNYDENSLTINTNTFKMEKSKDDGTYKKYNIYLPKSSYHVGENTLIIKSGFNRDYDDFEFSNIIIRFQKKLPIEDGKWKGKVSQNSSYPYSAEITIDNKNNLFTANFLSDTSSTKCYQALTPISVIDNLIKFHALVLDGSSTSCTKDYTFELKKDNTNTITYTSYTSSGAINYSGILSYVK